MARITLRQLLDHAAEHGYGVPAFNINNMEQALAIMEAAEATDSPVIMQASRGARSDANDIVLKHLIDAMAELYPHIPICMHQDHGNNEATCATAIQYGFTSVMMDGSLMGDGKTPADYDYNVKVTRNVVDMAHWVGASVEGELGVLGSLETGMGEKEDGHGFEGKLDHSQLLTDPDQAVDFVKATQVDALALAIDTDNRMAITAAIRKVFAEKPGEFDPRSYLKPAKEAMRKVCIQRFEEFGTAGHAAKITPIPLSTMAKRYNAGELAPKIGITRAAAE